MLILLKLAAAGAIGLAVLNPLNGPKAEDCECNAKADALATPHAESCECEADT